MKGLKNTAKFWDDGVKDITYEDYLITLQRIPSTMIWKRINSNILKKFKSYKNLEIVELGAGQGLFSMLMAKQGANVTLLDYSKKSLDNAKKFYKKAGVKANFVQMDLLNLGKHKKYDVVMSYGVAEHFLNKERKDIQKAHFDFLKKGGMSIVCVPNKLCVPYQIWHTIAKITGFWPVEEYPFSPNELIKINKSFGYKSYKIIGGSFWSSFPRLLSPVRFFNAFVLKKKPGIPKPEKPSSLDNKYAFELAFLGFK